MGGRGGGGMEMLTVGDDACAWTDLGKLTNEFRPSTATIDNEVFMTGNISIGLLLIDNFYFSMFRRQIHHEMGQSQSSLGFGERNRTCEI